jgi:hypothetical protein
MDVETRGWGFFVRRRESRKLDPIWEKEHMVVDSVLLCDVKGKQSVALGNFPN